MFMRYPRQGGSKILEQNCYDEFPKFEGLAHYVSYFKILQIQNLEHVKQDRRQCFVISSLFAETEGFWEKAMK